MTATLDPAWYDAIKTRHSRRRFEQTRVEDARAEALDALCEGFRPFSDARAVLVRRAPADVFTGIVGSYGAIEAPSVGVFIADENGRVSAGYVGEAFVLEATRLGLGTCWIAGSFDKDRAAKLVELAPGERVVSVTPVGISSERPSLGERLMRRAVGAENRRPVDEVAPALATEAWPGWATLAVEAARLAPSGANRQPCRYRIDSDALVISLVPDPYWTAQLDAGIAMLHAELGAAHGGVTGRWERLEAPDVARFVPDAGA